MPRIIWPAIVAALVLLEVLVLALNGAMHLP
jgi:hypothetical protein